MRVRECLTYNVIFDYDCGTVITINKTSNHVDFYPFVKQDAGGTVWRCTMQCNSVNILIYLHYTIFFGIAYATQLTVSYYYYFCKEEVMCDNYYLIISTNAYFAKNAMQQP